MGRKGPLTSEGEFEKEWSDPDPENVIEKEPLGATRIRWSKSAGHAIAFRTSLNRALNEHAPIFLEFGPEVFEVKPNATFIALEQLPLDEANDDVIRAHVLVRERVMEQILAETYQEIHKLMDAEQ